MKFVLLVKSNPVTEAGGEGPAGLGEAMGKYNAELSAAGLLLDAVGIYPSGEGGVRLRDIGTPNFRLIEGPFAEPGQTLAGYTVIDVRDRDEAIEWAKRMPRIAMPGDPAEIEIRQLY